MSNFTIGSFCTEMTNYQTIVKEYLIKSIAKVEKDTEYKLPIPYIIKTIENTGNWKDNVAKKPRVILDILYEIKTPLVFLDADCKIEQYPILFDQIDSSYDIAFHMLDWSTWYGYKDSTVKELLSGTLWLNNNDKIKELCKEWYSESLKQSIWEQRVLSSLINKYNVKVFELPLEYCYIDSLPNGNVPLVKCDNAVVIRHFNLSRVMKKLLKRRR